MASPDKVIFQQTSTILFLKKRSCIWACAFCLALLDLTLDGLKLGDVQTFFQKPFFFFAPLPFLQQEALPAFQGFMRHCIFLLPCFLITLGEQSCTPQIRYADRLSHDSAFLWSKPKRRLLSAKEVLEQSKGSAKLGDLNDRALAYARLGRPGPAKRIFYEILRQNSSHQAAYLNLLRLSALLEDAQELRKVARRFVLQGRQPKNRLWEIALGLAKKNRMAEARSLQEALFQEHGLSQAGLWLGADALAEGNDAKAKDYYEAVLEKNPKQTEALFALGWLYYQLPHEKTALDYLEAAYKAGFRSALLTELRARLYEKTGNRKKALAILKNKRNGKLIRLRGFLLLRDRPSADLRFLLRGLSIKKKQELLLDWYGMANYERYRSKVLQEFINLY